MTEIPDLRERRAVEQARIRALLNSMKAEEEAKLKGGENAVAWVKEERKFTLKDVEMIQEAVRQHESDKE